MEDVAPALLEQLKKKFAELLGDAKPEAVNYAGAGQYAETVGTALTEAFRQVLRPEALPDGRLYWNIADRVVRPMLEQDYRLVSEAAATAQQAMNEAAGIGIQPQHAALDTDRVEGLLNGVAAAERYEDAAWLLGEPVLTFSRSVADDALRANVEFQGQAGLRPKVVRRAESKCCKWCAALAGSYSYPDVPRDVYRRHARCRCAVEYDPGDGKRQNVWTKRWTQAGEHDKIEERKAAGSTETPRPLRILRGSGGELGADGGTVHKFLGKIDPADTETAEQLKDAFCKQYAKSPVENMMVITQNGEVHFATDNNPRGVDCSYLGGKLKGSYNIHSHPPESTQFSFSTDVDIPAAFADGTAVMEAVDYKYRYRFEVPKDVTLEDWEKVRYQIWEGRNELFDADSLDVPRYEEDVQHLILQETCRRMGINAYTRWNNG